MLLYDWRFFARPDQLPPAGDWTYWLVLAGRGFGKTRVGAETVRMWSEIYPLIHLVGPTAASARDVMVQGESGLLACFPPDLRPVYEPSKRLISFHSGAVAHVFSADEPERLRGPQCAAFWADEICAWRFLQDAWDNILFGFRLGDKPRGVITTTPKPLQLLKQIVADPHTVTTRGSSYANRANLAPAFFDSIIRKYEGTRIGRQELNAEILEDIPGALWTRAIIDAARIKFSEVRWERLLRIVVGVDPAVSTTDESDNTGIVTAALTDTNHVLVLDDRTCKLSPAEWGARAIAAYRQYRAHRVIGEVNNGGNLVERNMRIIDADVAFRAVRASQGKYTRAEPVAALYEQGRVHHVGSLPDLENEMCEFVPGAKKSPDRMDALVWAITDLVIEPEEVSQTYTMSPFQISPI